MARKYELKRRAEQQAETRRRIVEAAVELHRTRGPARTSLSDVARLAGVQRHTLYRHFPNERALFLACSGRFAELNPQPDPEAWQDVADPEQRLRVGLTQLYEYYERTADMLASVLRDAGVHAPTREIVELRHGGTVRRTRTVLGDGIVGRRRLALLDLALEFHTWQRLATSGLSREEAVEAMVCAVTGR